MGASGSSEGRDSWQRAQAGVSLAPPGCLRGPGAASPVTGPQLQVEQSRGGEKADWGCQHVPTLPLMQPGALCGCSSVCPKPGLTARSVLRRVRQRLRPVRRASSASQHAQQVQGAMRTPTDSRSHRGSQRQARPAASRVSHWDQKDEGAASGAAQAGCRTTSQPAGLGGERVCSVTQSLAQCSPAGQSKPCKKLTLTQKVPAVTLFTLAVRHT